MTDRSVELHKVEQALLERLDHATKIWRGEQASGGRAPRELVAAAHAVQAVQFALQQLRQPCEALNGLATALDDLVRLRRPPKWLQYEAYNRPKDSLVIWLGRGQAAFRLQQMIDTKISRTEAQKRVFRVLERCEFPVSKPETIYEWLKDFRKGESGGAPHWALAQFNADKDSWDAASRPDQRTSIQEFTQTIEAELATALKSLGFAGVGKKTRFNLPT